MKLKIQRKYVPDNKSFFIKIIEDVDIYSKLKFQIPYAQQLSFFLTMRLKNLCPI